MSVQRDRAAEVVRVWSIDVSSSLRLVTLWECLFMRRHSRNGKWSIRRTSRAGASFNGSEARRCGVIADGQWAVIPLRPNEGSEIEIKCSVVLSRGWQGQNHPGGIRPVPHYQKPRIWPSTKGVRLALPNVTTSAPRTRSYPAGRRYDRRAGSSINRLRSEVSPAPLMPTSTRWRGVKRSANSQLVLLGMPANWSRSLA